VDIDDTLINTDRRRWAVWRLVLNREIEFQVARSLSSEKILRDFASGNKEQWKDFWKILLCCDERGIDILQLDEPIPFAAEVMQRWAKSFKTVYLTGRTSNMYELTLQELAKFGFPAVDVDLVMSPDLEDYLVSPEGTRRSLVTSIVDRFTVVMAVDDNPLYMTLYQEFGIPQRIGFLRSERFSRNSYRDATRIVDSWKELLTDDPSSHNYRPKY